MTNVNTLQNAIHLAGVRALSNALEVHAVNKQSETVLQGWFPHDVGMALVGTWPSTFVACDPEALPERLTAELEDLGHAIVRVPSSRKRTVKRRASEICGLGVRLVNKTN